MHSTPRSVAMSSLFPKVTCNCYDSFTFLSSTKTEHKMSANKTIGNKSGIGTESANKKSPQINIETSEMLRFAHKEHFWVTKATGHSVLPNKKEIKLLDPCKIEVILL